MEHEENELENDNEMLTSQERSDRTINDLPNEVIIKMLMSWSIPECLRMEVLSRRWQLMVICAMRRRETLDESLRRLYRHPCHYLPPIILCINKYPMNNLRSFRLVNCCISSELIQSLAKQCKKLERFDFCKTMHCNTINHHITNMDIRELSSECKELTHFKCDWQSTGFDEECLRELSINGKNLKVIEILWREIHGSAEYLKFLPQSLEEFIFNRCDFSDQQIESLCGSKAIQLHSLSLGNISGKSLQRICNTFKDLTKFTCKLFKHDTEFYRLKSIPELSKLKELMIRRLDNESNNKYGAIDDEFLDQLFTNCPCLTKCIIDRALKLNSNLQCDHILSIDTFKIRYSYMVSDRIIPLLCNLKQLSKLEIENMKITDKICDVIDSCKMLSDIKFHNCLIGHKTLMYIYKNAAETPNHVLRVSMKYSGLAFPGASDNVVLRLNVENHHQYFQYFNDSDSDDSDTDSV